MKPFAHEEKDSPKNRESEIKELYDLFMECPHWSQILETQPLLREEFKDWWFKVNKKLIMIMEKLP